MTKNTTQLSIKLCLASTLPMVLALGCGDASVDLRAARNPNGQGPAPVSLASSGLTVAAGDLGAAGNYVILSKAGISNVTGSTVTGNMAVSPAAASYITGFSLSLGAGAPHSTSSSVVGKIYAVDYATPTPTNLTVAIGSMETAYTDASSRINPDFNELATGNIGGLTLTPGLYTWTTSITVPTTVTISGGPNDVWIFQTTGDLVMDSNMRINLAGGALAKNIYWQIAGQVTIGTDAHFEGIILSKTAVTLQTRASMNGRIFAQSLVALDNNTVTQP